MQSGDLAGEKRKEVWSERTAPGAGCGCRRPFLSFGPTVECPVPPLNSGTAAAPAAGVPGSDRGRIQIFDKYL